MRTIVHNRRAVAFNVTTFATLSTIRKYLVMPLFMIATFFMCSFGVKAQTTASALQFDGIQHIAGTTDYVSVNSPFTTFNKEITVEYWMYTPSANMPFGSVMGQGTSNSGSNTVWLMHPNSDGTMTFYVNDAGTWRTATCNIVADSWHHYAGVANATSTRIYVDGVLSPNIGAGISGSILNNASSVIHMGKDVRFAKGDGIDNNDPRFANMSLDEVRIWNRALCQDEIKNNMNCELNAGLQTGLEEYYRFNQGVVNGNNAAVTTLTDATGKIDAFGNSRNGTLNNFLLTGATSNWITSGSTNKGTCLAFVASAPITGTTSICKGASTTLSNAILGGVWTSSNMAVATINASTGLVNSVSAGVTTISYKTPECGGVSTATLTVNALPLISAGSNSPVCKGFTLNLSSSGGMSYNWTGPNNFISNAQTPSLNNIVAAAAGTYSVKGTDANGCSNTATVVVTVNTLDSDGDGIPDACDDDADNDGIPNALEGNKSNFFWSNPPTVNGNSATGTINGIGYTYTSSSPVATTGDMYGNNVFPVIYGVPNTTCIQNTAVTQNTINFASPMTNPLLVFASIGQSGVPVGITFGAEVQVVFSQSVVQNSITKITGTEGYAIVRMMGTFSSISFNYLVAENYCNFAFGADFQGDTDGDGIPDYLDLDSDNDGCPDAIEGSGGFTLSQTSGGRLLGGVDGHGIPLLAGAGQGIGTSQNYLANCLCQPKFDTEKPVITCPSNKVIASCETLIPNYTTSAAVSDNCTAAGSIIVTQSPAAGVAIAPGATVTITLTATDAANNASTCIFTVSRPNITPVANADAAVVCAGSNVIVDVLSNDSHPQGLTLTVSDNTVPSVGTLVKNADNTFTYTAPTNYSGPVTFTYTTKANDGTKAFAGNGHYYEFVSAPGITWTAARAAASAKTFNGLKGYLITITSAAENNFMFNKVGTTAWIGGSDMAEEGVWKWMDGPEAGQQFSGQNKTGTYSAITPPQLSGSYHNWAVGEPNDYTGFGLGSHAEDYAHFRNDGAWNDFPNNAVVSGYAVEYGGLESCLPILTATATVTITVNPLPTFTSCPSNLSAGTVPGQCSGTVNYTAIATGTPVPAVSYTFSGATTGGGSGTGSGQVFNIGVTTVTITATNTCGSAICSFTITVKDTQMPNVVTQNVTVYLDNNGQATIIPEQVDNGSSDNCGIATRTVSPSVVNCTNLTAPVTTNTQTIVSDNSWMESTTTYSNPNFCSGTPWSGVTASLPLLSSYTVTPTSDNYSVRIIPGTQGIYGLNGVRFFRKTFNLSSLAGIKATFLGSMDNGLQIFINGVAVAIEKNIDGANFGDDIFSRIILNSTGANLNGGTGYQLFDDITNTNASSLFVVGTNEIVLALANCDGTDRGALSFKGIIENNVGGPGSVVLTVTDIHGNESSASALITVIDAIKPVINCPNNKAVFATSASGAFVTYVAPVGTDNCSVTTVRTAGLVSGSTFPIGKTTVTYRATDASGNFTECSFIVTVQGLPPVIHCPANIVVNNTIGQCGTNVSFAATETVGIPASTITYSIAPGSYFPVGTTQVTATATNAVGSSSCSFNVTVEDNQPPVLIGVPGNTTVECNAVPAPANVTATDNCTTSVPSYTETKSNGNCPSNYTLTRVWSTTDASNNTTTQTQVITVQDTKAPTIITQAANSLQECDGSGNTNARALWVANHGGATASDVCSNVTWTAAIFSSTPGCSTFTGSWTYTFTATDACGNSSSTTATFTIEDHTNPVITSATNSLQECDGSGNTATRALWVANHGGATASDVCSNVTWSEAIVSSTPGCSTFTGSWNYKFTAKDDCGNASSTNATFTIEDHTNPVITCPASVTVNCQDNTSPAATGNAIASDICSGVTISSSDVSTQNGNATNAGYYNYVITRTWVATDACGNSSSCVQLITVHDVTAPVLTIPANINVTNDLGVCGATISFAATATDNCSSVAITYSSQPGRVYPVGTTTVTVTAKDISNNTTVSSFTIKVVDNEAPVTKCKPVTITLVNGSATITAASVNNNSTDNCGIASYAISKSSFNCSNIGANAVILTIVDIYGNTSSCTATVTVVGEIPSCTVASIPASNVYTGGNPNALYLGYGAQSTSLKVTPAANGAPYAYAWSGNSPAATSMLSSITSDVPVFTPTTAGSYTFTVVTTNVYGCATSCSITICVTDVRVPGTSGNSAKVYICHLPPGNPANRQTLSISVNAVNTHLTGHTGDKLGTCDQAACTVATVAKNSVVVANTTTVTKELVTPVTTEEELKVTVMPNPTTSYFTLKLESKYDIPVEMRVMDVRGRVVDEKSQIGANSTIQIGHNYSSGTYYAEMIQGTKRKVIQLIKAKG